MPGGQVVVVGPVDGFPDEPGCPVLEGFGRGVAVGVVRTQVVEQAAALPDELEQPAARVVVLGVRLEVIREVGDAVAQELVASLARPGERHRGNRA